MKGVRRALGTGGGGGWEWGMIESGWGIRGCPRESMGGGQVCTHSCRSRVQPVEEEYEKTQSVLSKKGESRLPVQAPAVPPPGRGPGPFSTPHLPHVPAQTRRQLACTAGIMWQAFLQNHSDDTLHLTNLILFLPSS